MDKRKVKKNFLVLLNNNINDLIESLYKSSISPSQPPEERIDLIFYMLEHIEKLPSKNTLDITLCTRIIKDIQSLEVDDEEKNNLTEKIRKLSQELPIEYSITLRLNEDEPQTHEQTQQQTHEQTHQQTHQQIQPDVDKEKTETLNHEQEQQDTLTELTQIRTTKPQELSQAQVQTQSRSRSLHKKTYTYAG